MSESRQLIVELDAASDPVQGTIGPRDEGGTPFSGYVQLIAALEGYRQDSEDGATAAAVSAGTGGSGERPPPSGHRPERSGSRQGGPLHRPSPASSL